VPTILLVGAFGQDDPGSEALLEAFLGALDGWRVVATHCSSPWKASPACEVLPARAPAAIAAWLREVDGVVVTGDRAFATAAPETAPFALSPLAQIASICAATSLNAVPVALVGVGAHVLPGSVTRRLARFVIGRAKLVVVNNEEAAWALEHAGARPPFRVGADPAWTVLDPGRSSELPPDPAVAGSVVVTIGVNGDHGVDPPLVGGLELVARAGVEIRLERCRPASISGTSPRGSVAVRWAAPSPRRGAAPTLEGEVLVRALGARLGRWAMILDRPFGFEEEPGRFAGAALVVAQQPFTFMAAMAAGVPAVALGDDPRLMALARRFRQRWVLPGAAPGELADAVMDGLGGPRPSSAVVAEEVGRAHESFRLMRLVLGHGDHDEAYGLSALPFAPSPWVAPHRRAARLSRSGILSGTSGRRPI
jgi:hypothetical protein